MDTSRQTYAPQSGPALEPDDMSAEGGADALMNTVQAAAYLNLSPSTLEKDRCSGQLQVPYLKLGTKRVAYDRRDLERWKLARRRCSTSQRAA